MLNNLRSNPKARNHRAKRVGRGFGSGIGGRSTRGTKGQSARKSGTVRLGFEGGQTPLYVRVGKIGFNNRNFAAAVCAIALKQLARYPRETKFDVGKLIELGLIGSRFVGSIKVIGDTVLPSKAEVHAHAFSRGALAALRQCGGSAVVLPPPARIVSPVKTAGKPIKPVRSAARAKPAA